MSYSIIVNRKDFTSYQSYLSVQEYSLVKRRIVEVLKHRVQKNATLLDVGCWDGEVTQFYSEQFATKRVCGIEIFPDVA